VSLVLVTPNRFPDLEPERALLSPLGAEVRAAADAAEFERLAPDAEVLMITAHDVDAELIGRLGGRCRAIVRYGVGVDSIDVAAATRAGIPVGRVPDASVEEVADHAVALALSCLRRLPVASSTLAAGGWGTQALKGTRRLRGLRAGIVGLGRIGLAVAARLQAFGLAVHAHDPNLDEAPYPLLGLEQLLAQSELLSLHLPLTDASSHLIGPRQLDLLPPGSVIVNVSRGGLIDELALAARLRDGRLAGAGLDVFESEPLPADSPLRDLDAAILTPHVAWYSGGAVRELQEKAAAQAVRALSGKRLQPAVDDSVYEDSGAAA
jgi:D-3-phosphoglycerate dehydrogenase